MSTILSNELSSWSVLATIAVTGLLIYLAVIVVVRLNGLRSFSKMSAFDFAMTVAVGTLLSSTMISKDVGLFDGLVGLATLFLAQRVISWLRSRTSWLPDVVDNAPVLLMDGPRILEHNLKKVRLTEHDLRAKLREANVMSFSQIRAVVFESTGDVSVLHAGPSEPALEAWIMEDVDHGAAPEPRAPSRRRETA